jgi:hypothetical protein
LLHNAGKQALNVRLYDVNLAYDSGPDKVLAPKSINLHLPNSESSTLTNPSWKEVLLQLLLVLLLITKILYN